MPARRTSGTNSSAACAVARPPVLGAIALLVLLSAPAHTADRELEFQKQVYQDALDCIQAGGNRADCFVRASPKRCATQAVGMVSDRGLWQRNWLVCVRSCANAGWWDKTMGDCRR